jgi:glucan phosphoethanolaminetransferase (alkaline phosphatase superfamily)
MKKISPKVVIPVVVVVVVAILLYFFSQKGEILRSKKGTLVSFNKPTTPIGAWQANAASEDTKDVFFNGELYTAQFKTINGKDYALLPDGNVVVWNGNDWEIYNSVNF